MALTIFEITPSNSQSNLLQDWNCTQNVKAIVKESSDAVLEVYLHVGHPCIMTLSDLISCIIKVFFD
jgi:hypothetical protein